MCVTSVIYDYAIPRYERFFMIPIINWEERQREEFNRLNTHFRGLLKEAENFDKDMNEPDCVDPEKEKLLKRIEELEARLSKLEK